MENKKDFICSDCKFFECEKDEIDGYYWLYVCNKHYRDGLNWWSKPCEDFEKEDYGRSGKEKRT